MRKNEALLTNKKVLVILPQEKFEDREYLGLVECLGANNLKFTIATSSRDMANGIGGTAVIPDCLINDINVLEYDAISLIGGVGSIEHWHNAEIITAIKKANKFGKLICAICLAPVTLANAGLLKNKKATVYKSAASYLRSKGAFFTGNSVEISDNIITANGPKAVKKFAETIVLSVNEKKIPNNKGKILGQKTS